MSKSHPQRKKSPIWQFWRGCRNVITALTAGLVRAILRAGFHRSPKTAGFVLPTVVMVSLVVTLLVAAISFNSFQASKRASNTRVNTTTLNAALPALDRARVKLNQLFQSDPSLPGGTPSDTAINNTLTADLRKYTFGDEDPLEIVSDFRKADGTLGQDTVIQAIAKGTATKLTDDETSRIAWRFPVDTDNNGKFDSYTLYGIFFRSPETDGAGQLKRARTSLEARTPPMEDGNTSPQCATAGSTSASLVGTSGWYSSGVDQLTFKRGIFVYTVNVPITRLTGIPSNIATSFETYRGNKGLSALEYQQDQVRLSLGKNAIVYEDDLEINPGGGIRINGRIQANSNVFLGKSFDPVEIFQVSSSASCYYQEANSKIVVGGNIINGNANKNEILDPVPVYLYDRDALPTDNNTAIEKASFTSSRSSTTVTDGSKVAYNSKAFEDRINFLVESQIYPNGRSNPASDPASTTIGDPKEVIDNTNKLLIANVAKDALEARTLALQSWFRARTRRVPYGEVPYGNASYDPTIYTASTALKRDSVGSVVDLDTLRGPDAWIYPTEAVTSPNYNNVKLSATGFTGMPIRANELQAMFPDDQKLLRYEKYIGDRIQVGNNLPARWYDSTTRKFNDTRALQYTDGSKWTTLSGSLENNANKLRYRRTQVQPLADLGDVGRNGFWEQLTAKRPQSTTDSVGGLRIVTGAGIYGHQSSYVPPSGSSRWPPPTTSWTGQSTLTGADADSINGLNKASYMASPTAIEDPTKTCPNRDDCKVDLVTGPTGTDTTFFTKLNGNPVVPTAITPKVNSLAGKPFNLVWPDSMPMQGGANQASTTTVDEATAPSDLRMRATAVYHYSDSNWESATPDENDIYVNQVPTACVSSYYDPTTRNTARNRKSFAGVDLADKEYDVSGGFDRPQRTPDGATAIAPTLDTATGAGPGGDGLMDEQFDSRPNAGATGTASYGIGKNKDPRPDDSSATNPDGARSNNGIVYPSPYDTPAKRLDAVKTYWDELTYQALLMFPNSRVVNQPLLTAMNKFSTSTKALNSNEKLSLADTSAIDTAICAIRILTDATFKPSLTDPPIPHGTIQEIAFLDARQIKQNANNPTVPGSLTRLDSTNNDTPFDLSVEERMPLEVRATMIDLQQLRSFEMQKANNQGQTEYLLPLSGLVYATRDDALLDQSDKNSTISPVDFKLDPTRRPNGIVLRNGRSVARYNRKTTPSEDTNKYREGEKGLILATQLPVYVWGTTNIHEDNNFKVAEEFTDPLKSNWDNFNSRGASGLNKNFACRREDSRLPNCTEGDRWRPISIQSDAFTILSDTFRPGFRNQGDYDLRNNWGTDLMTTTASGPRSKSANETTTPSDSSVLNRRYSGFRNNNYVTSYPIQDSQYSAAAPTTTVPVDDPAYGRNFNYSGTPNYVPSSYLNNFVTPVQRRMAAPEYIMETCRKIPVSLCQPSDWVVGFDINGDGDVADTVTLAGASVDEWRVPANRLGKVLTDVAAAVTPASKQPGFDKNADGVITFNSNADVDLNPGQATSGSKELTSGTNTKSFLARLGAGTTARPALPSVAGQAVAEQRYARRVAFARNIYGALAFTSISRTSGGVTTTKSAAKPLGVGCPLDVTGTRPDRSGCQYPDSNSRTAGVHYGWMSNNSNYDSALRSTNALWFRATENIDGVPSLDPYYGNPYPMSYVDPVTSGFKLILPDIVDFPGYPNISDIFNNQPAVGNENPADYTVCIGGGGTANGKGSSQNYEVGTNLAQECPDDTFDKITGTGGGTSLNLYEELKDLPIPTGRDFNVKPANTILEIPNTSGTLNVVGISDIGAGSKITLKGDQTSIFVLQASAGSGALKIGAGVTLELDGVDPNKVFWVVGGATTFEDATQAKPTRLAGNFISDNANLEIGDYVQILGGRLLGFAQNSQGIPATATIQAATNNGQPLPIPVLQIHVPQTITTAPDTDDFTTISGLGNPAGSLYDVSKYQWLQHAEQTTANVLLVTGDTPIRPQESTGSVANLVRYLESWKEGSNKTIPVSVSGMIMQYRRSAYATGPFQLLTGDLDPETPPYQTLFGYPQGYVVNNARLDNNKEYGAQPHYIAPERRFGYDVALQTQSPDQFAQRLTIQPISRPNEFFREIGSNDPWVQALLCAGVGTWVNSSNSFVYKDGRYAADNSTSRTPTGTSPRPTCPIALSEY